ncbi:MAG: diguanylate cyclase, partial [Burkholderiaceae bacterium]
SDLDVAIAPVWINPVDGAQGIPVTRRLAAATRFDGIVAATVNPAALSVAYARTESRGTAVGVLGADGIFRSRTVDGRLTHGERADPARLVERAAEVRKTGVPVRSLIDGVTRFLAAVKVDRYPLYAVVAVDAEQALENYRHTRARILTWAAVFTAGTLVSGWIVLMQARQLDSSRRRTKKAEATFRATLEGSLDAVTILAAERDPAGVLQDLRVTDCNTLAASLVGLDRAQLLGRRLCTVAPSMLEFLPQFDRVIQSQQGSQAQMPATEPHLLGRWLHHQLVPLDGGVALITRDVTDKKAADGALAAQARSDGLTKLANRRHFEEFLDQARARAMRGDETLALICLDLDGFKSINDRLGHAAGDAVLVEVARRLKTVVRETDLVARLGGDEFVVIAENAGTEHDVRMLCARIVDALAKLHPLAGHSAFATSSVGAALFDGVEMPAALCKRADAAMYIAKKSGKSRYALATDRRNAIPLAPGP